jgi:hypothetical protein
MTMRKVEQEMIAAIRARKSRDTDNTRVECGPVIRVYLFGNLIAEFAKPETHSGLRFTLAGWNTNTTRSRVKALLQEFAVNATVYTREGDAYFSQCGQEREIGNSEWVDARTE